MSITQATIIDAERIIQAQKKAYSLAEHIHPVVLAESRDVIDSRIKDPNCFVYISKDEQENVLASASYVIDLDQHIAYAFRWFSLSPGQGDPIRIFAYADLRTLGIEKKFNRMTPGSRLIDRYRQEGHRDPTPIELAQCMALISGRFSQRADLEYLVLDLQLMD